MTLFANENKGKKKVKIGNEIYEVDKDSFSYKILTNESETKTPKMHNKLGGADSPNSVHSISRASSARKVPPLSKQDFSIMIKPLLNTGKLEKINLKRLN